MDFLTFTVRIPEEDYKMLKIFSSIYELKLNQIASKAVRKFKNSNVENLENIKNSTLSRVCKFKLNAVLSAGLTGSELKKIIHWYANLYEIEEIEIIENIKIKKVCKK